MPCIDVAVPCYQYGRYLRDCVTSITSQDVEGLRVLIIDNGSTDNSLEVAQELARRDERITIAHHPHNLGQKHTYNQAIDWASAPYFMILDADDVLAEGALSRAVAIMDSDPTIAFCHGIELRLPFVPGAIPPINASDRPPQWSTETGLAFIAGICRQPINPVGTSTVVMRTSAQKLAGHYHPSLKHADDVEMSLRLATFGKVARTNAVQAVRRLHAHQLSRDFDEGFIRDCEERFAAYAVFFRGPGRALSGARALHRTAERSLASKAYWSGLSHLVRGHRKGGIALLRFAFGHCPSMAILPPLDWLMRIEAPWERFASVLASALRSPRAEGPRVISQ
jgi:glycosyltransferase involved in cell wall biosynthesis